MKKLEVFDATSPSDIQKASSQIQAAITSVEATTDPITAPPPHILPNADLIGISADVYAQINAALISGKAHLMFYGPPGTGKTQLAIDVASQLSNDYALVTGSSDWTSQDLIGGYMPANDGKIHFVTGLLLENFDKPFVIDELNRCDIDKVLGPLFTVLSGSPSTLPYLTNPEDPKSLRYTILGEHNPKHKEHEFSPTPYWRMLATINSIDKASLYQMSYALTRRFAWILVDVPADLLGFVVAFCAKAGFGAPTNPPMCPMADIWAAINHERKIGPAPIIDVLKFCRAWNAAFDFFSVPDDEQKRVYLGALSAFILPMLDGITSVQADRIVEAIVKTWGISPGSPAESDLHSRFLEFSI